MRRIYWETVKKWAKKIGLYGGTGTLITLVLWYVAIMGYITITGYSGDIVCAGTLEDPCIAEINFTTNEDWALYKVNYDPYGRNTPFEFDPNVKEWKLYRTWGKGLREIPLDTGCTGSWCGCSWCTKEKPGTAAYYFRAGRNYTLVVKALKNNPYEDIEWGFGFEKIFDNESYVDPIWYGISDISWKNNNMTIEFKKGEKIIGQTTLKSHRTYDEILKIPSGKNRTVIWYEFHDFKDVQINALENVKFIDMREEIENKTNTNYLKPINKTYNFVYLNKTFEWDTYDNNIPKENIIIGVQTDLAFGELLDVRFNIMGVELDRHAIVLGTSSGFVTVAPTANPYGTNEAVDNKAFVTNDTSSSNAGKITEVGWFQDGGGGATWEIALYAADGDTVPGEAGTLLYSKLSGTKTSYSAKWEKISGLDWDINGSTDYWISFQVDDVAGGQYTNDASFGGYGRDAVAATSPPNPFGGGTLADSDGMVAVYALWAAETISPTYSLNSTNSTNAGEPIEHRLKWEDNVGLSGYIFSLCNGSWDGSECVGSSGNSTKTINEPDSGILDDDDTYGAGTATVLYVDDADSGSYGDSFIKFNISDLPSNRTILSATFYMYVLGSTSVDDNDIIGCWGIDNYTWNEEDGVNADMRTEQGTNFVNKTGLDINDSIFVDWNITSWVSTEYSNGKNNFTIGFYMFEDADSDDDYFAYYSKEHTISSERLYLEIVYTDGWVHDGWVPMTGTGNWSNVTKVVNSTDGANIAWKVYANDTADNWNVSEEYSYVTISGGDSCDWTSGNFEIDCSEYCHIDATYDLMGNNITTTGSGMIYVDNNVTNFTFVNYSSGCAINISSGIRWG